MELSGVEDVSSVGGAAASPGIATVTGAAVPANLERESHSEGLELLKELPVI